MNSWGFNDGDEPARTGFQPHFSLNSMRVLPGFLKGVIQADDDPLVEVVAMDGESRKKRKVGGPSAVQLRKTVGNQVFVYYNLRKHCWSVKSVQNGRVAGHTNYLVVQNARFKVSESGRQRVLREQRKNVHAGVRGSLTQMNKAGVTRYLNKMENPELVRVSYNPYKCSDFVTADDRRIPVKNAEFVIFTDKGCFVPAEAL